MTQQIDSKFANQVCLHSILKELGVDNDKFQALTLLVVAQFGTTVVKVECDNQKIKLIPLSKSKKPFTKARFEQLLSSDGNLLQEALVKLVNQKVEIVRC